MHHEGQKCLSERGFPEENDWSLPMCSFWLMASMAKHFKWKTSKKIWLVDTHLAWLRMSNYQACSITPGLHWTTNGLLWEHPFWKSRLCTPVPWALCWHCQKEIALRQQSGKVSSNCIIALPFLSITTCCVTWPGHWRWHTYLMRCWCWCWWRFWFWSWSK